MQTVAPTEPLDLTVSELTKQIDRSLGLLADRRRRFCLYHLYRADSAVAIRDLAELVEASVTPSESTLTDLVLDEAVLRLYHTHLPKLENAGLVRVNDSQVELSSNRPMPIHHWLSATAAVELDQAPSPLD